MCVGTRRSACTSPPGLPVRSRDSAASTAARERAHSSCRIRNAPAGSAASTSNDANSPAPFPHASGRRPCPGRRPVVVQRRFAPFRSFSILASSLSPKSRLRIASTLFSSCATLLAPTTADVTRPPRSTQASAICASD